ncbi:glycoside hydrolase family 32 protein [Aeromicrobium sp. 9AM]|uniref:glycoside hydrolase family 32 protein n=1 Tax=Aeromicrobium sp. 9AM TaxID=2653126 RepID=UPI0012F2A00E
MDRRVFLTVSAAALLAACTPEKSRRERPRTLLRRSADAYRPRVHYSPARGNLADPNGLVYLAGEYHLFFQHDGRWAHAASKNRLHWRDLGVAIDREGENQALSGSAVVDRRNTSGLVDGSDGLVAVFTSTDGGEAQSVASSSDRGRTFTRYDHNPVLRHDGGGPDFRDPKVFWHADSDSWVMVVSSGDHVSIFGSPDLIEWSHLSDFGQGQGLHSAVWECPDLFSLPLDGHQDATRWVMHVSVGASEATDGSTSQYFVGTFDGTTFVNENAPDDVMIADFGQDFYAAQTWSDDHQDDKVWIGWLGNWRYPYGAPTGTWHGAMSLPRTLSLETRSGRPRVVQQVIDTAPLRRKSTAVRDFAVEGLHELPFHHTAYELEATVEWDQLDEVAVQLMRGDRDFVSVGFDARNGTVFVDRSASGSHGVADRDGNDVTFGRRSEAVDDPAMTQLRIHAIVDRSSIEVFFDNGRHVASVVVFTDEGNDGIAWQTTGGRATVRDCRVTELAAIWS